jgi:hypothetical protein
MESQSKFIAIHTARMRCFKCNKEIGLLGTNDLDMDIAKTMTDLKLVPICLDCLKGKLVSYRGAEK